MAGRPLNHHPRSSSVSMQSAQRASALKIVICYLLFGCLWILFSDELLSTFIANKDVLTRWQIVKGWTFIGVTALMLYALITRSIVAIQQSNAASIKSEA